MTYPIEVRQFEFGNQGYYQYRETVRREVHDSSCYSPVGNGCCSETIAKRTYQWVEYKGKKYVVTPACHPSRFIGPIAAFQITLVGPVL